MNILIVGLGVIGASFAKGLKNAGYKDVYGVDISKAILQIAEKEQIILQGYTNPHDILKDIDICIVCLYPNMFAEFVSKNASSFKKGSIVVDTSGIKQKVIDSTTVPEGVDIIYTHPMAGRQQRGIEYSDEKAFIGANYIITPTESNNLHNIEEVEKLARDVGFEYIIKMSPQNHDLAIAHTSQLPHVIAVSLICSDNGGFDTKRLIGDSYKEITRIANINEDLWSELFLSNSQNLLDEIASFEEKLELIKSSIENNDADTLKEIFVEATNRRTSIES